MINGRGEKKILIGEAKIKAYLKALAVEQEENKAFGLEKFKNLLFPFANAEDRSGACKIGEECER